jgi:hypothetical protein
LHLLANLDRTLQKIGEGTSLVTWTVTGKTGAGRSFTLTRANRFASQFDVSFSSIFEMLSFLSVIQGQPFVEVHFSKVTITASADELFRQYRIDKVLRKTGTNTYAEVNSRTPIRVRAGHSVQLRVRLAPFKNRGPLRNFDFTYRIPRTGQAALAPSRSPAARQPSPRTRSACLIPTRAAARPARRTSARSSRPLATSHAMTS